MEYKVVLPEDPMVLPVPMVKFIFTTDDDAVSFIVEDKLSLSKLEAFLDNVADKEKIISIVKEHFVEEQIGETEFSKITGLAKIKRLLPSED